MDYEVTTMERDDKVAIITINRPEAMNALNSKVLEELTARMDEVQGNNEIWCVILTGAGKAFVAGADIAEMSSLDPAGAEAFAKKGQALFDKIEQLRCPVIAAINGFALGGGCEISMACDIRYASVKAKLGQPEVNLGLMPGFGGTQRLSRLVGRGKAKELIFSADMVRAEEAHRIGLVDQVFEPEELMEKTVAMAKKICSKAPIAVSKSKQAINEGLDLPLSGGNDLEAKLFGGLFALEDTKEGTSAFLEKREANFQGK